MKNEYFQNDVIDLRILVDIGSVCISRFPFVTSLLYYIESNDYTNQITVESFYGRA